MSITHPWAALADVEVSYGPVVSVWPLRLSPLELCSAWPTEQDMQNDRDWLFQTRTRSWTRVTFEAEFLSNYFFLWKKCYWIQYSWYWNVIFFTHLGSFFLETSRRFDLSSRSLGHVMWKKQYTLRKAPHQWTVNRDTSCPRSTTSSCFLSSSRERKHHVTKASRWEVETSWSFKKKRSKVSKKITFQYFFLLQTFPYLEEIVPPIKSDPQTIGCNCLPWVAS